MIINILDTDYVGVLNIGTDRKSAYEYAIKRNTVEKGKMDNDLDFSLNTDLYKKLINNEL